MTTTLDAATGDRPVLRIFIDGGCALCSREATFMERRDAARNGVLEFVDLADASFDPAPYGVTYEQFMKHIHGQLPDGSMVHGMEVFRRAYRELGMGWLLAPTGWPVLKPVFDVLYAGFARIRMKLPGNKTRCEVAIGASRAAA